MPFLDGLRATARAFTRPIFKALGVTGDASAVTGQLLSHGMGVSSSAATVATLFDAAYQSLLHCYRCEFVYKNALANHLAFHATAPPAGVVIEQHVASSFVDVAAFGATSAAYEIKTEFDSPKRLTTQTNDYLRAFDRVYLVTHPTLAARHMPRIDARVGVLTLETDGSLNEVRAATPGISEVEPITVLRMLRRHEYMDTVHVHHGVQPALPNGLLYRHYEKLFVQLSSQQAHEALMTAFVTRTQDGELADFLGELPKSLRALGFATPLSRPQRRRVLKALAAPL
ncbi:sce7726 family protein [Hydrogenophaga sp. 2FB]|uniref:sce7726 family protein n=1 Tax=Hydrogenophaga sp. 2FB TaxID=2502187 RepID=UPI0010FA3205|nr:sce7726 family protein [Hydrogenophaga sp. 2FB]